MPTHTETVLVQLSDPHIVARGRLLMGHIGTADMLSAAVRRVLAMQPQPSAVLVTGDLVDDGQAASYVHLRELLAPLGCPVWVLPGNHDDAATLREVWPQWPEGPGASEPALAACYAVSVGGLRLVALDSTVPGQPHGELSEQRLAWLAETLAAQPDVPTVLALHHPPFTTGIGHMDLMGLRVGREALWQLLAQHRQVQRVVAGHLHRHISLTVGGVLAMTAPSTAHQIGFDLRPEGAPTYAFEPAGFLVHHLRSDGSLLSHAISSDDGGGARAYA